MSLSSDFSRLFPSHVQDSGWPYFRDGNVRVTHVSDHTARACVQGSRRYHVNLRFDKRTLSAACTCSSYQNSFKACKHIWATILEVD